MVTVKADDRSRVKLPDIKPGQVFAYETFGEVVTLTPVKPIEPSNKGRLEKHGKTILGVTEKPITSDMVKQALADFP